MFCSWPSKEDQIHGPQSWHARRDNDHVDLHAVPDEERNSVPGEVGAGRLGGELGGLDGAADCGKDADGEDQGELDLLGEGHLEGPDDGDGNSGEGDVEESGIAWNKGDQ